MVVRGSDKTRKEAHAAAETAAQQQGVALDALSLEQLRVIDARIDERVFKALSVDASVASRASHGGTAPDQVRLRVAEAMAALEGESR